uniref:Enoyl-[acyl-carrier-protein] reductase [NADH] n=1 Tax=Candidatus Kentrum sp. SD TaxID=2126332 RepID=A0A451BLY4_9GAMM|nr:MAG: Enoyl-[acyl-carrier-protein] reductase [NADH] [Candidatus Kentron sp. SD]VFK43689.1 MAG: Enoyl-[acyl-carrier-protein] reductase [NADH] [Candidatus Kentron sp. SD]VFK79266.1 MAG: Enoyl-[acyl-carrier-protein] reductase [NADH] [Candidatus Kentron sp. SD]
MGFLSGKRALIVGVASNRSIAWGIAKVMHREGAELAFTYQTDKLGGRVRDLAAEVDSNIALRCDVSDDNQISDVFTQLNKQWKNLDIIVHSVAFANREELHGDYLDNLTRQGFLVAQEISSYSFAALGKMGRSMLTKQTAALVTLSFLGGLRIIPNYNVMGPAKASLEANIRYMGNSLGKNGIRVNGISAGPIRTLAAAGISDFRRLMDYAALNSALGRNITIDEVGNVAAFLCSDLASGITNEIIYVDAGFRDSYSERLFHQMSFTK